MHPDAALHVRGAFERSVHPMLLVDDQRRCVTGNAPACRLFGVAHEEIAWRAIDDFAALSERVRLEEQWGAVLLGGGAEGAFQLLLVSRGSVTVEFSAITHVLPGRHLAVFIDPDASDGLYEASAAAVKEPWAPVVLEGGGRMRLTKREREIVTLIAYGSQTSAIAGGLFVSTETVKSHVHNAMTKLGASTRAHAVAIALITGQIAWPDDPASSR